jgi:uncharacterized membrane protein
MGKFKNILVIIGGINFLFSFSLFWLARLVGEFAFPGGSIIFGIILFLCVLIYLIPAINRNKKDAK